MEQGGMTWIVAADGAQARIFAEARRAGPVKELDQLRMTADPHDRRAHGGQQATVHDRVGAGRHSSDDHSPADDAEERFLRSVASFLGDQGGRGAFDSLVLMAPPKALGILRDALPTAVARRVEATDAHERLGLSADEIQACLRAARARS
ncbi:MULTISPECIES: baeRF12 domain-containing protein [Phenylobacterium]|uniref:Protein required for attachment to host cells n=1 Tax=Phenylobacterium koreense TaxID=266125 RepID=A0ABV2EQ97_9CAUL